jgi:hypothetical protein
MCASGLQSSADMWLNLCQTSKLICSPLSQKDWTMNGSVASVTELTWLWYSMPMLSVLMRIASSIPCWKYLCSTTALMTRRIPLRHEQQQVDIHLHGTLPLRCLWCLLETPPSSIMAQSPPQGCSLQHNSCSGLLHHRWRPSWSSPRASKPAKYQKAEILYLRHNLFSKCLTFELLYFHTGRKLAFEITTLKCDCSSETFEPIN